LEIGIALGGEPDLLLLDEPTAGMSPEDSMDFAGFIARIAREKHLTVIFVEHDMNVVFSISDYIRVLHQGALIAGGSPEEIRENEEVQRVYMGGAEIVSQPKKDERADITLPSREVDRLLNVEGIDTFYGSSHILFNVSLKVNKGEVVCLLGRNGVGKTTTLRSIMGLTRPRRGYIRFLNEDIVGRQPFQIAKKGMGYVPGDREIFPDLTVMENLEMAKKPGPGGDSWDVHRILTIFPELKTRQTQKGGTLSGGEQQMLTIARSLMGNPLLLLLDEPSEGLAPKVVKMLFEQLSRLKEQGMSILICEQNMNFALRLSDRAYILEKGQVCWRGSTKELSAEPEIMKQHLSV
jgi:branched-chain amino acid transport system ATP-binding protein